MSRQTFADRREAGAELARHLEAYRDRNPIVLGLPRGGIVVAYEVARELDADLDVLVANKIGAPGQPEFAIGAVAANGTPYFDQHSVRALRLSEDQLDQLAEETLRETRRRMDIYRGGEAMPNLANRTVIIVDDGLATGATARAAIDAARGQSPRHLVLAVPVGAPETVEAFRPLVDEVVCPIQPERFRAVGLWYRDFGQTTDDEVLDLLGRAHHAHANRH